jgi:hypothetical protein
MTGNAESAGSCVDVGAAPDGVVSVLTLWPAIRASHAPNVGAVNLTECAASFWAGSCGEVGRVSTDAPLPGSVKPLPSSTEYLRHVLVKQACVTVLHDQKSVARSGGTRTLTASLKAGSELPSPCADPHDSNTYQCLIEANKVLGSVDLESCDALTQILRAN